ncbi:MAG: peptide MFS transporter [Pseudomonadales bacterium]|nr:peptide MFS transporter [Pseudomonadales bacterium]
MFSYYGMRALLMLYLTKHFLFGDREAGLIYGSYGSLVYATPVIGGLIADRFLGHRKAVAFGAFLLVCGHFGMAFEGPPSTLAADGSVQRAALYEQIFYLSLSFIIVGVGFLKANISTIVGQLYGDNDPRRDGGFTIFYMGINVGAFTATLACAWLGETYGWRYGFGLAGIGMLFGLLVFHLYRIHLLGVGEPPSPDWLSTRVSGLSRERWIYIGGVAAVFLIWQLIQNTAELGGMLLGFGAVILAWGIWFALRRCTEVERDRMLVMLFLIFMSVVFWALFEQAGSSLTLFTDRNIAMGNYFTAGMFQSLNPFYIIVLAPVFAWAWVRLSARGLEPTTPAKFGLGILQVGLGFAVLVAGASFAGPDGKVAVIWLALMYLLHTTGELCLSPVGLSMITKLSVKTIAALMMGIWFLSSSFAHYLAGMIAAAMAIQSGGTEIIPAAESLIIYTDVFAKLAMLAVVLGVVVLALSPVLHKRMHGVH